jgi:hypothetical protein
VLEINQYMEVACLSGAKPWEQSTVTNVGFRDTELCLQVVLGLGHCSTLNDTDGGVLTIFAATLTLVARKHGMRS